MSLLDDLKKEAEEVKAKQQASASSTQQQADLVRKTLRPRLAELYKYFKEMKEQLEVVQPVLSMDYDVPGFGTLSNLKQGHYRIFTDNPEDVVKFTFGYAYSRDGTHDFKVGSAAAAQKQKEALWAGNLRFKNRDAADGSTTFILEAFVPVTFEFEANFDKAAVSVRVKNLNRIGASSSSINPDKIDQSFMDEFGKCVLHKENNVDELMGNVVPDETRMRLRQQLEESRQKREAEAAASEGGAEKPERVSISKKFGRTFFGKK